MAMSRNVRIIIATISLIAGLAFTAYNIAGEIMVAAVIGAAQSMGSSAEVIATPLARMAPYLGALLILTAIVLFFLPFLKKKS